MNSSEHMDQQVNATETDSPAELDAEALEQIGGGQTADTFSYSWGGDNHGDGGLR